MVRLRGTAAVALSVALTAVAVPAPAQADMAPIICDYLAFDTTRPGGEQGASWSAILLELAGPLESLGAGGDQRQLSLQQAIDLVNSATATNCPSLAPTRQGGYSMDDLAFSFQ